MTRWLMPRVPLIRLHAVSAGSIWMKMYPWEYGVDSLDDTPRMALCYPHPVTAAGTSNS